MPKSIPAALVLKKNTLDPQGPWLVLYDLEVTVGGTHIRVTNHADPVIFQGNQYEPYPVRHEAVIEESQGRLQKVVVHVANAVRELQYYLENNDGLRGKKVAMHLINADDPSLGAMTQDLVIEAATSNDMVVSFVLGKPVPVFEVKFPGRLITRDTVPGMAS